MRVHTGEMLQCSECTSSFTQKSQLVQHMRVHTGEKFQCSECTSSFTQKSRLVQHMRVHTGEMLQCSECTSSFTQKSQLVQHMRVHTGEKFQCSECTSSFTQKSRLVQHMRVHTGEKFKCSECTSSYTHESSLVDHMRVHTGEMFQCSECTSSFTKKSNSVQHMRVHTGDTPYHCTKCNKSFTKKCRMIRHIRVHTREKFQCCDCQKCFPSRVSLTRHSRTHLTSYSKVHAKDNKCHKKYDNKQRLKKCGEEKSGSGRRLTQRNHHLGALRSHTTEKRAGNDLNSPEPSHNNCRELPTSSHSEDEYSLSYQCKTKAVCKLADNDLVVSRSTHFIDWSGHGVKDEPVDGQPSILSLSEDPLQSEMVPPSSIKLESLKEEFEFLEEEL
ncbi:zinc finger protein 501-like [Homarus americanus]|uniref:zinc finger protein 501-like n=1 Tax=Homarus americanus TaxID=6706 RepID=UPI001C48DBB6|nr:zinc finger protein 501-like [Homarus americanus]